MIDFPLTSPNAKYVLCSGNSKGQADVTDEREKTDEPDAFETVLKTFTKKNAFKTRHKLKAHTSKIVSSFKAPQLTSNVVKEYRVRETKNKESKAIGVHFRNSYF